MKTYHARRRDDPKYMARAKESKRRSAAKQNAKPEARARRRAINNRIRREQTQWLAEIKLKAGCADCGYRGHHAALDFDHVRGVKVADVTRLKTYRKEVIMAEIAKCEVVCANCHRIRTHVRRNTCNQPE